MIAFTIIIVSHGKEERLTKCLESLRPSGKEWQLIILSKSDLSEEMKARAQSLTPHFEVIVRDLNSLGKSLNETLSHVEGEWIYLTDEYAYPLVGYWDKVLKHLDDPKIDVFGGPDIPALGMKASAHAYSVALSSPFCTGPTFSRHKSQGTKLQFADEENLSLVNLWMRKSVLGENPFSENYESALEVVLLQKLKNEGKGIYYDPNLRVGLYREGSFSEITKASFSAGQSRSHLMKKNLSNKGGAYWLPAAFVLFHFLIFLDPVSFWYLVRMYASIIVFVSIALTMRINKPMLFILVSIYHYVVVFSYGTGFLCERLGLIRQRN